jgi:hypothetical protein
MPSFTIQASSDNATDVSNNGSEFTTYFNEPIEFPKNARNKKLGVITASYWNVIPNIATGVNDRLKVSGFSTVDVLTDYNIVIPQGLFSLDDINSVITQSLESQGAKTVDGALIELSAQYSTNKCLITFNYNNVTLDFTAGANGGSSLATTLGWAEAVFGTYATVPATVPGAFIANLDSINGLVLHSDIVNRGISYGGKYSQTIAVLNYTVKNGFQEIHEPYHITEIDCDELHKISSIKYWLTDTKNRAITMTEPYAVTLRFTYD